MQTSKTIKSQLKASKGKTTDKYKEENRRRDFLRILLSDLSIDNIKKKSLFFQKDTSAPVSRSKFILLLLDLASKNSTESLNKIIIKFLSDSNLDSMDFFKNYETTTQKLKEKIINEELDLEDDESVIQIDEESSEKDIDEYADDEEPTYNLQEATDEYLYESDETIYKKKDKQEEKVEYVHKKVRKDLEDNRIKLLTFLNDKYEELNSLLFQYKTQFVDDSLYADILLILPEYVLSIYIGLVFDDIANTNRNNTNEFLKKIINILKINIKKNRYINITQNDINKIENITLDPNSQDDTDKKVSYNRIQLLTYILEILPIREEISKYNINNLDSAFYTNLISLPDWFLKIYANAIVNRTEDTENLDTGEILDLLYRSPKYLKYLTNVSIGVEEDIEEMYKKSEKIIPREQFESMLLTKTKTRFLDEYDKECYSKISSARWIKKYFPGKIITTWLSGDINIIGNYIIMPSFPNSKTLRDINTNTYWYKANNNYFKLQCNKYSINRKQNGNIFTCFDDKNNKLEFMVGYTESDILNNPSTNLEGNVLIQNDIIFREQLNELFNKKEEINLDELYDTVQVDDIRPNVQLIFKDSFYKNELKQYRLPVEYINEIEEYIYDNNKYNLKMYLYHISSILIFVLMWSDSIFINKLRTRQYTTYELFNLTINKKIPEVFESETLTVEYKDSVYKLIEEGINDCSNVILIKNANRKITGLDKLEISTKTNIFNIKKYYVNIHSNDEQILLSTVNKNVRIVGLQYLKNLLKLNVDYAEAIEKTLYTISENAFNYIYKIAMLYIFSYNQLKQSFMGKGLLNQSYDILQLINIDNTFLEINIPEIFANDNLSDDIKAEYLEKINGFIDIILYDITSNVMDLINTKKFKIIKNDSINIKLPQNFKDFSQNIPDKVDLPIFIDFYDSYDGNDYILNLDLLLNNNFINPLTTRYIPENIKSKFKTKETTNIVNMDLSLEEIPVDLLLEEIYNDIARMENKLVSNEEIKISQLVDKSTYKAGPLLCKYCTNYIKDESNAIKSVKLVGDEYKIVKFCDMKCFNKEDEWTFDDSTIDSKGLDESLDSEKTLPLQESPLSTNINQTPISEQPLQPLSMSKQPSQSPSMPSMPSIPSMPKKQSLETPISKQPSLIVTKSSPVSKQIPIKYVKPIKYEDFSPSDYMFLNDEPVSNQIPIKQSLETPISNQPSITVTQSSPVSNQIPRKQFKLKKYDDLSPSNKDSLESNWENYI